MEEKKSSRLYRDLILIIITTLVTCTVTTIIVYSAAKNTAFATENNNTLIGNLQKGIGNIFENNNEANVKKLEEKISQINNMINSKYIGEIDEEKLIDGALEGYVDAIGDEYTEYLDKDEVNALKEEVNSSYVGIGVYIAQVTQSDEIMIIGVIKDSPAEGAGLLAGDIIKKIDGKEYAGSELTKASNNIKGNEGTNVNLLIKRNDNEMNFDIKRGKIEIKQVSSDVLENNIGYIKISAFEGKCADQFKEKYKELEGKGIKSLIIDLRNNGGGLVDESLKIADYIVPKGATTLIAVDKNKNEEVSKSNSDPIVNVPVVILVNEYTASASEILTGAVMENTDIKVVGKKTYGKGVIQGIYLLKDKETAMKITIQEYFTPNRNKINKTGITPDYEVELPDEWKGKNSVERQYDTQLKKAIELLK